MNLDIFRPNFHRENPMLENPMLMEKRIALHAITPSFSRSTACHDW
jgi:hypothetical protein